MTEMSRRDFLRRTAQAAAAASVDQNSLAAAVAAQKPNILTVSATIPAEAMKALHDVILHMAFFDEFLSPSRHHHWGKEYSDAQRFNGELLSAISDTHWCNLLRTVEDAGFPTLKEICSPEIQERAVSHHHTHFPSDPHSPEETLAFVRACAEDVSARLQKNQSFRGKTLGQLADYIETQLLEKGLPHLLAYWQELPKESFLAPDNYFLRRRDGKAIFRLADLAERHGMPDAFVSDLRETASFLNRQTERRKEENAEEARKKEPGAEPEKRGAFAKRVPCLGAGDPELEGRWSRHRRARTSDDATAWAAGLN